MATVQREVRKRGFVGKLIKWTFIAFNLLMIAWVAAAWMGIADSHDPTASDAAKTGEALGAFIGTSMILFFWVLGDIVLGLLVVQSRGERILITEER